MRALISVSNKTGVAAFAKELVQLGWEIVSTGGTAEALRTDGVPVISIDEVTGFPEMMDGRVKTLHPKVHGGLLARRDNPEHVAAMKAHGITAIDLVAVNLYPFRETVAKQDTTFEHAIENIDIGGPSMLRSAAKNHSAVIVVVDPADYAGVIAGLKAGGVPADERRRLATKVYAHTSAYDAAITNYLATRGGEPFPPSVALVLERQQSLRYGENPHQPAALYVTDEARGMRELVQLHGKELSFNNLLDVDAAVSAVLPWAPDHLAACVIIKHTTPCGLALAESPAEAYQRALATDKQSAFGSVIAYNVPVDRATAEAMRDLFVEVVVAPAVSDDALAVFREKKNIRVITLPRPDATPTWDYKRVRGGFLVQERFRPGGPGDEQAWTVPTRRKPTDAEWKDLRFAWAAVGVVKSNAILLARNQAAIGIGAGQMSRVDSSFLAVHKARQQGHDPKGSVLASDAYFPFRDGMDEAAAAGVRAVIQPGGSVRDPEVIAAADEHDVAMVLTGTRQFRH